MAFSPFARIEAAFTPPPLASRIAFLTRQPFAHRGLHRHGLIENSRAAFRAAIAVGHGIELDVQPARDGEAVVFHDATLDRLTDETGRLDVRPVYDLETIALSGTNETLCSLDNVLAEIAGRVPVLIEIKSQNGNLSPLCLSVRRALEGYGGPVAIMSFNPNIVAWFRRHSPYTVRGLVVTEEKKHGVRGAIERLASLLRAQPDFLAYDVRDLPSAFASRARKRGIPVLTWTVRTAAAEAIATRHADEAIYERPEAPSPMRQSRKAQSPRFKGPHPPSSAAPSLPQYMRR
jgi:glycerophosphoryl diester phosphodiesterase